MIRRPPRSPLFPYPPLFRSGQARNFACPELADDAGARRQIRTKRARTALAVDARRPASWIETHILIVTGNLDRKSTRLNSSHLVISYAVFCLKKKKKSRITHGAHPLHPPHYSTSAPTLHYMFASRIRRTYANLHAPLPLPTLFYTPPPRAARP